MREFVAVDVGPQGPSDRGGAPAHLTLRFLGEVPSERNAAIVADLEAAARGSAPFALRLEGVGAFPSTDRPRVVWVGVTTGRAEVVELARRVQAALEPEFGRDPGEFVPHLTLFRVRTASDRAAARELLAGTRPPPPPRDVTVAELLLKASTLLPRGATHRTLRAIPLGSSSTSTE